MLLAARLPELGSDITSGNRDADLDRERVAQPFDRNGLVLFGAAPLARLGAHACGGVGDADVRRDLVAMLPAGS